jgi:hypothetical protein
MADIILLSSEIAVGHCVILNDYEQPCGKYIVVIIKIENGIAHCKYLNSIDVLDQFNDGGMKILLDCGMHQMTPVSKFGVEVHYDTFTNRYTCERVRESIATYDDNTHREWQEHETYCHLARYDVIDIAIKAARSYQTENIKSTSEHICHTIPTEMMRVLADTQMLDFHDDNGPGIIECPVCHARISMRWKCGKRLDSPDDIKHDQFCPVAWAKLQTN